MVAVQKNMCPVISRRGLEGSKQKSSLHRVSPHSTPGTPQARVVPEAAFPAQLVLILPHHSVAIKSQTATLAVLLSICHSSSPFEILKITHTVRLALQHGKGKESL